MYGKLLVELILNYLTKITLPKSVSNYFGNHFAAEGILGENAPGASSRWQVSFLVGGVLRGNTIRGNRPERF